VTTAARDRGPATVVWHVTEAMGGGLETAINHFVRSTPECSHHLVGARRPQHRTGEASLFTSARYSSRPGPWGLARLLLRPLDLPAPDVVHAHSAWAGLIARVMLMRYRAHMVYSPHAYYFERTDISPVVRWAVTGLERFLARLTRGVVAVSPHEAALAVGMGTLAWFVPNVAELTDAGYQPRPVGRSATGRRPRLVTVGRVEPQKDPRFFAATVRALQEMGLDADVVWVGAGDPELEEVLTASGVRLTGWVDRETALDEVRSADVYVHTAAWEGNPLTVLEAEALGRPVAVRSIPAMVSLGHPAEDDTPQRLAERILSLAGGAPPPARQPVPLPAVPLADVYATVATGALEPAARS
jgi:glycosyltransferase involved in cell wall biosynthesis